MGNDAAHRPREGGRGGKNERDVTGTRNGGRSRCAIDHSMGSLLAGGPTSSSAAGATRVLPAATAAAAATLTVGGCLAAALHSWRRGSSSSSGGGGGGAGPDLQEPAESQLTEDARICKHWRKRGSCRRGDDCKYSHPEALADTQRSGRRLKRQGTPAPSKAAAGFTKGVRVRLEGEQRFRAVVQYDGTDYDGWQTQPHGRTIQDELEQRLGSVLLGRGKRLAVAGSGRTDAGVHAAAQVFHFECPRDHWKFNSAEKTAVAELTAERLLQVMQHGTDPDRVQQLRHAVCPQVSPMALFSE